MKRFICTRMKQIAYRTPLDDKDDWVISWIKFMTDCGAHSFWVEVWPLND